MLVELLFSYPRKSLASSLLYHHESRMACSTCTEMKFIFTLLYVDKTNATAARRSRWLDYDNATDTPPDEFKVGLRAQRPDARVPSKQLQNDTVEATIEPDRKRKKRQYRPFIDF